MRAHKNLFILSIILQAQFLLAGQQYTPESLITNYASGAGIESGALSGWQSIIAQNFSGHALYWGTPIDIDANVSPEILAQLVSAELNINSEFELLSDKQTPTREYMVFREQHGGLPIIGGRLDLALNNQHQLARVSVTSFASWPTRGAHIMSQFVAATYLISNLEHTNWQVETDKSFACWYPSAESQELYAAYWLRVAGPLPHQRYCGIVSAANGEILLEWSGVSHDVLNLTVDAPYWQPYDHSETQVTGCAHQNVNVNGIDRVTLTNGTLSIEAGTQANVVAPLSGPFVEVSNDDDGEVAVHGASLSAPFTNEHLNWTTDQATRPELNLYYHTVFIHDWYKVIDPTYDALDYPMPAVANYGGAYDNAFWDGFGTYYGAGMNYGNFAMYSDVIYHEYTHGVTDGIYPDDMLPYTGQPGAMNEAWSDYFACTINGDPLMAEWLTGSAHSSFRDLESQMVFPRNWTGEVHGDSPFISAPLWTIRRELGAGYADSLAHFARYALSELFFDYFVAVLETDDTDGDLSNGTPNATVIYDAFGVHGIGPGASPHIVITNLVINDAGGNNNGKVEAGETVSLRFSMVNDVMLFPPSATNVQVIAQTSDNTMTLSNEEFIVPIFAPRDTVNIGPINISVNPTTADHWGVVTLTITADQLGEPFVYPIEFTIGIPKLHVVTRSLETEVDTFVTRTLRSMDKIFEHKRLTLADELDLSALPDTGVVLWLSGDGLGSGLLPNDTTVLSNHIYNGGYVFMSGKNILGGIEGTDFARWTLGVDYAGRSRIRMATCIMFPFIEDQTYLLTGSGGAANQDSMTILQLTSSTLPVLMYGIDGNNYAGAMGPVSGHSIVFGFGIEAIADNSPIGNQSRTHFMERILTWAHFTTAVEDDPVILQPLSFILSTAYPNPFNSSVRLDYNIGNALNTSLVIYDVLGREVHHAQLSSNSTSYTWQPSMASGVYFAILKSDEKTTTPLKLLLLR